MTATGIYGMIGMMIITLLDDDFSRHAETVELKSELKAWLLARNSMACVSFKLSTQNLQGSALLFQFICFYAAEKCSTENFSLKLPFIEFCMFIKTQPSCKILDLKCQWMCWEKFAKMGIFDIEAEKRKATAIIAHRK